MDEQLIKTLTALIAAVGNVSLEEAVDWLKVKANAESLLHEIDAKTEENN